MRSAFAAAAVLLASAALGCSGVGDAAGVAGRPDAAGDADQRDAAADARRPERSISQHGDGAFLARANTACLQARVGGKPAPAGRPEAPRAHARQSAPFAAATLAALYDLQPPMPSRAAVDRLRDGYERLSALYTQAAAPGRGGRGLSDLIETAEQSVRSHAGAARLPACAP